jgi:hypothetical protein
MSQPLRFARHHPGAARIVLKAVDREVATSGGWSDRQVIGD